MPDFEQVHTEHVHSAIAECDKLGADSFRRRYGFREARQHWIWYDGRSYDTKAILGVAQRYATGRAEEPNGFTAGSDGAGGVLRALGFEVVSDRDEPAPAPVARDEFDEAEDDVDDVPAAPEVTWREASEVGQEESRAAWASEARGVLEETAGRYQGVIHQKELARLVQLRSGIRTKQLVHYWITDVLTRVVRECAAKDEPLLPALCVNAEGGMGEWYATAVREVRGSLDGDADDHAAHERLSCYRRLGAEMPDDGGSPTLTPKFAAARELARRPAKFERVMDVCPTCNTAVPASGVCDYCD